MPRSELDPVEVSVPWVVSVVTELSWTPEPIWIAALDPAPGATEGVACWRRLLNPSE